MERLGAADLKVDNVTVIGTQGADKVQAAAVEVTRADKTLDTLHVDTRLGNDSILVAPQVHNLIKFSSS